MILQYIIIIQPRRTGPYQQINHQFNHHIADTYNNNNDNYEIYQTQNYPSQNLFIENGPVDAGYGYTEIMVNTMELL